MIAIGEAARLTGLSVETIRYYEREGIVEKAGRTASGRRAYTEREISELRFIKRCRDLGFTIQDACALRELSKAPEQACRDVEDVATRHLDNVRSKIAALQRLEQALAELVQTCTEGAASCPLLTALLNEPVVKDVISGH